MPKKKKFIDKKNAITFHLVHRSQHDPLVVDETAPQRVLLPVKSENKSTMKKNKEEEIKYGVYFDDDYDYLQHLRGVEKPQVEWVEAPKVGKPEKPKLNLPSSMFASNFEEDIGLLNKSTPQSGLRLDLDPDIVAAMDEDFNYSDPDNELEDNFVELANVKPSGLGECSEDDYRYEDEDDDFDSNYSGEEYDEVGSLKDFDTKSRFTDYSMSSSVISRNSQLTLLDETFEQMFTNYDESEIGALDCDEIEGEIGTDSHLFKVAADEFEKGRKMEKLTMEDIEKVMIDSPEESDAEQNYLFEVKEKEKWDCESILSTYSNIYNHPKLIKEPFNRIQINKRTGIPIESGKLTKKTLAHLDNGLTTKGAPSIISTLSMLSIRDKNETPEEKKERKRQLREYRKDRRSERKANSIAFKEEKKKLEKTTVHNKLNRRGILL